jgi:hypothetical protein
VHGALVVRRTVRVTTPTLACFFLSDLELSFAKIKRGPRFRQESPGIVGKVADVVMVERGSRRKI